VAAIATGWNIFITIVFMLPQVNPVTSQTLNYSPVAVGIVLTYALGFWLISARKWFTGPIRQVLEGWCSSFNSARAISAIVVVVLLAVLLMCVCLFGAADADLRQEADVPVDRVVDRKEATLEKE
jgi:type VI protein secretion system component VasK